MTIEDSMTSPNTRLEISTMCDVSSTVHLFVDNRRKQKKRQYHSAARLSQYLILGCLSFLFADIFYPSDFVFIPSCALFSLGVITISVCPLDELDIDEFSFSHPRGRTIIACIICAGNVMQGLASFPYAQCLAAIPDLLIIFGGSRVHVDHNPRATTLGSVDIILKLISYGLYELMQGLALTPDTRFISSCPKFQIRISEMAAATMCFIFSVFLTDCLIRPRSACVRYPTLKTIEVFYGYICCVGINSMVKGITWNIFCLAGRENNYLRPTNGFFLRPIVIGVATLLPPLIVAVFGRQAVFGFLARRFDRNNAERDGAFLAELYAMDMQFSIGDQYWMEKENFERYFEGCDHPETVAIRQKLASLPNPSDRSDWLEGVIIDVDLPGTMKMKLRNFPRYTITLEQPRTSETSDDLLRINSPRCVEWSNLSSLSMQSYTSCGGELYQLSRPLGKDEQIDFFVSHSWRDDHTLKWRELVALAESFKSERGRYPTFWIDKFCLRVDRGDPTGALTSLCVYIMACDRMVVLCGMSFPSRLWCAWELFTIFAFQHEHQAMGRIHTILLGQDKCSGPLERLKKFNVANASCYSPLDEQRIMKIIDAVGRNEFNEKVRNIAGSIKL